MQYNEQGAIAFEDDFFLRSCKIVTSTPDVSLTELVANSWDAGALKVNIKIPDVIGEVISIEDNGIGMTDEQFRNRWMMLNYNRQKRQGTEVEFPKGIQSQKRMAYGRNGIGRHSMFCFSDNYTVETWRDGVCNKYMISSSSGLTPFEIVKHSKFSKEGHGTYIYSNIKKNVPKVDEMVEIISARYLYDPNFNVEINNKELKLSQYSGLFGTEEISVLKNVKVKVSVIDSTKSARKSKQHGIAFWVSGRLVGKPSWSHGNFQFLDGRSKAAKRFTLVVQTEDLTNEVLPDWTGFHETARMKNFFDMFRPHVVRIIKKIMQDHIKETQMSVIQERREELEELEILSQRKVSTFIEVITEKNPIISQSFLNNAVEAVINIEKASKGRELLIELSNMSNNDIDKLADMLMKWNIDDVLAVLNEVNRRIIVIEAIEKIHTDKDIDELHTLHPLVLDARWLFGTEFDSPMFVSNVTLNTVVEKLFKNKEYDKEYIENPKRRPDIVVLNECSIKAVCTDRIDIRTGGIMKPDQILIIELKRGGYEIKEKEVMQAEYYTRQIKKSGVLHNDAMIHTFVVGCHIGDVDVHKETSSGIIDVVTYAQLIETASQKLFRLRDKLYNHYAQFGNESIVEEALSMPKQIRIEDNRSIK